MSAFEDRLKESLEHALSVSVFVGAPFAGLTDEEAEAQDRDRFPRSMIENTTEYDWEELPNYLQDIMRNAAREFAQWADQQDSPLVGELANELEAQ